MKLRQLRHARQLAMERAPRANNPFRRVARYGCTSLMCGELGMINEVRFMLSEPFDDLRSIVGHQISEMWIDEEPFDDLRGTDLLLGRVKPLPAWQLAALCRAVWRVALDNDDNDDKLERVTYGSVRHFESEADGYEAITGRRSTVWD